MTKKKFKYILKGSTTLFIVAVMLIILFNPKRYLQTTFVGLKLWATTVLPSLLPFFFLTALLQGSGVIFLLARVFKRPARLLFNADGIVIYIRILSLISGYPVGAKIIADLYSNGIIDSAQAQKYALFCSTSGPIYIVGTVACGLLSSPRLGFILLLTHYLSSLLNGIIFRKLPDNGHIAPLLTKQTTNNALYDAMFSAVSTLTLLGGFIAVFYTFCQIALDFKLLTPLISLLTPVLGKDLSTGMALGLIECTSGCQYISTLMRSDLSVCIISQIIAFGGVSVWVQSMAYLNKAKVSFFWFALSKIVQTLTAFPICYILLKVV